MTDYYTEDDLAMPLHQQPTHNAPGLAVPLYLKRGTVYRFEKAGDQVDWHKHELPNGGHSTQVTRGVIDYCVEGAEPLRLREPEQCEVPPGVRHRLVAVEAGSECMNVRTDAR